MVERTKKVVAQGINRKDWLSNRKINAMKKLTGMFLLLASFLIGGNAQAESTESTQHKGQHHRGHKSHGKRDDHRKGVRLFHRHHHRGKGHLRSDTRSHHGHKGNGDKESNNK